MNPLALTAMRDEMEKIARAKVAGPMWNGMRANAHNTIKGMFRPVDSMKKGWKYTVGDWNSGSMLGKGMMAFGAAAGLPEAVKREDPTGQGRSRVQRISRYVGSQAGGLMAAPFGFTGNVIGSIAGEAVGGAVGKTVDKVRGYRPRPQMAPAAAQGV